MNHVFANLTATSPTDSLCVAAGLSARSAAMSDVKGCAGVLRSDAQTLAFLADPETRSDLEHWIGSYRHDEASLAALAPMVRAEVLASAWLAYSAVIMQARDAARDAARRFEETYVEPAHHGHSGEDFARGT